MPQLGPEIKAKVESLWADEKSRFGGKPVKARQLHRIYLQRHGHEIGLSTFNKIVRNLENGAPPKPFPTSEWKPWANPEESPEDIAFLLEINAVKWAENWASLDEHEAKWGRRLRVALDGLHAYGRYQIVSRYGLREIVAYYSKRELYTADLDGFLAYKPWLPENRRAYDFAVSSGIVPYPFKDSTVPPPSRPFPGSEEFERWRLSVWGDSPSARRSLIKNYHSLAGGPWNLAERVLTPIGTQVVSGSEDVVAPDFLTPESIRVARREGDQLKAWMLGRLLEFWSGKRIVLRSVTDEPVEVPNTEPEGVTDEREHP